MAINTLSDNTIKNAKPRDKQYKLFDGGGLYLIVTPNGGKWWRMKYRYQGKEKMLALGVYPALSLKDARELRELAKNQLARGLEPLPPKKTLPNDETLPEAVKNSFKSIADEWFAKFSQNWSASNSTKVLARLQNDVYPLLGEREISLITAPELLHALQLVEKRGAVDTAHRILQDCGRIFRYAIATGRAERDVSADLKGALPPARSTNFATITTPREIGQLLRAIDEYQGGLIVRTALQLAPLFFVRPGELCKAQWGEFDFARNEWRIPAERMKMRQAHIVPLAKQAVTIIEELRPFTGDGDYLFPSSMSKSRPISDMALLTALRRMGYEKGQMTVHGFRAMASTLLNEQGYNRDWIERQLAHGERNNIRAAYNHAEHLPERRRMMQEWADFLYSLKLDIA